MATTGERRALVFLAAVAVLGAGTRAFRARQGGVETAGIDQQIAAVESSQARPVRRAAKRKPRALPADPPPRAMPAAATVDLDRASAAEIERLPGIGPALALRIVSDRDSAGPFGCLAALDAVKGIGPTLLRRLDSLASFSGVPRASCVRDEGERPGS